jgi:hypothetical protein
MIRLGASSSLTLSAWVDVLHLSSKWEITVMRAAAIAPLISPMDKLVFGRLYDVESWVLDALVGILGRKEDLSIEEARRMQLEDVVAIAKGRRDAQILGGTCTLEHDVLVQLVATLYPQEFGHLLQVILNSSPPSSTPAGEHLPAEALVEDTGVAQDPDAIPSQERMADLRRWICFIADPAATEHYVSRACLVKYADKHPAQRPTIFDLLMQQGLERFKQSEGKYFAKNLNAVVQAFGLFPSPSSASFGQNCWCSSRHRFDRLHLSARTSSAQCSRRPRRTCSPTRHALRLTHSMRWWTALKHESGHSGP